MTKQHDRKQYEPPRIRVIELDTRDVMAVGCKNDTGVGPATSLCGFGGGTPCSEAGS